MYNTDYTERAKVYSSAIELYGVEPQMQMAIEEMSELTKELCKFSRGKNNLPEIADEIADVIIMLEQLRIIFDNNDLVCERVDYKVNRMRERVEGQRK